MKCAKCGKAVESKHTNAKVYHQACIYKMMAAVRARVQKFNPKGI